MSDTSEPQQLRPCTHVDKPDASPLHGARISTVEALDRLMAESGQEK